MSTHGPFDSERGYTVSVEIHLGQTAVGPVATRRRS